ncbi:YafY family transcriptional regulator [Paenibacillus ginsengarvi]|uniref:YafY family transcriptional regulator n=3 Tax=Paenibacillus ginsengarvi TaxID=400777 RepID=A0A3B0AUJ7_9BACL|nr:YafY family transcriptional regulator [Paenibacillus ginsengarvi]
MKIDRLVALIMILLEQEMVSAGELAERLEVSRRTIYRDIDTLNLAGLPIFTHQGAMGGVGLMKSYKVGKTLFTPQEIQAMLTGLQSYKQLFGQKETVHALEKLNAIRLEKGETAEHGKFVIDLSLNQGNDSLRTLLSFIEMAINEQHYLTFAYTDRNGQKSNRKVEPYQVVFKEGSWYLQAFCEEKEDYRVFKLARMSGLQVLPEEFEQRDFSPLPMNGNGWMSEDWVRVTIRIDLSVMDKVIERFGPGHIVRVDERTCLAIYPIIRNSFGYDKLLAFGDKCEVVEPADIRLGFRAYVRGILAKYEQD